MKFLVYKKFNEQEKVTQLTEILAENGIAFEVTEDRESLDSLYGDKHFKKQYFVKINGEDFSRADSLLERLTENQLAAVDKDHYLFSFTDEELFDIVSKPDEWNDFDYQLAKKILKDRGKEINQGTIDLIKNQRLKELAKPEEGQKNWIYAGYLFAMLGGLLGIFIGWHLNTFKKTLPNGQQVYGYNSNDRKHGGRILLIGIVMFCVSVILRLAAME
jgi:hypothetical protein